MSTLTICLPEHTAQRLKSLTQTWGLSVNKLMAEHRQAAEHWLGAQLREKGHPIYVLTEAAWRGAPTFCEAR